jgi:hypothetical protein
MHPQWIVWAQHPPNQIAMGILLLDNLQLQRRFGYIMRWYETEAEVESYLPLAQDIKWIAPCQFG